MCKRSLDLYTLPRYLYIPLCITFLIILAACLHWYGKLKPDYNYIVMGEEVYLPIAGVTMVDGICIHRNIFH